MKNIQELSREREKQLNSAHELQRFYKDLEEAEYWMSEKYEYLDNAECGDSLRAVRRLLRKHEGFQRDLYALDDKASTLIIHLSTYAHSSYPNIFFKPIFLMFSM